MPFDQFEDSTFNNLKNLRHTTREMTWTLFLVVMAFCNAPVANGVDCPPESSGAPNSHAFFLLDDGGKIAVCFGSIPVIMDSNLCNAKWADSLLAKTLCVKNGECTGTMATCPAIGTYTAEAHNPNSLGVAVDFNAMTDLSISIPWEPVTSCDPAITFTVACNPTLSVPIPVAISGCDGAWGPCSVSCGGGLKYKTCTEGFEVERCNQLPCADMCNKCELTNSVGYIPDLLDCRQFYQCRLVAKGKWQTSQRWCPDCTTWDDQICTCSFADCEKCISGGIVINPSNNPQIIYSSEEFNAIGILSDVNNLWVFGGSKWLVNGVECLPGAHTFNGAIVLMDKQPMHSLGNPAGEYSTWTDCFANCSDPDRDPLDGQQNRNRHYVKTDKPDNWCDGECTLIEESQQCSSPLICPTVVPNNCSAMIVLNFENNVLDSNWNVSVLEYHGRVGFVSPGCDDTPTTGGYFKNDGLQIDFFNNYFTDVNNEAFTVQFCIKPESAGTIMTNGCDNNQPSFSIRWNETEHIIVCIDTEFSDNCCVATNLPAGSVCTCYHVSYNGDELRIYAGCGSEPLQASSCSGGILNNKCPLIIGNDNISPSPDYYEGTLDDVVFYRLGDPFAGPCDCGCNPPC